MAEHHHTFGTWHVGLIFAVLALLLFLLAGLLATGVFEGGPSAAALAYFGLASWVVAHLVP